MPPCPMRARRAFEAKARSVAQARQFTRTQLEEWDARDLEDMAVLLVSELVTNAVVHAGTPVRLELGLDAHNLRIEVQDHHPGRSVPETAPPSLDAEGGRGLMITTALASTWGVEYEAGSKRVWVVCRRPGAVPAPAGGTTARDTGTAHVGVVEVSPDGLVTSWNQDAATLLGWSPPEMVGRPFQDLVVPTAGHERPPEGPGEPWQGSYVVQQADGSEVEVFASHGPDPHGGGTVVLLVPEERRALLEHPAVVQPVIRPSSSDPLGLRDEALLRLGVEDYLTLAVERTRDPVGADAAYLLLAHDFGEEYEVAAVSGLPESLRGHRLDPGALGAPDARSPHLPQLVSDLEEVDVPWLVGTDLRSLAVVPVVVEGRVVGGLGAASESPDGFTHDQSVLLQRLADSLAVAADRARLQASERERRGWLSFIAEAGDLLAASLDQHMTMAITGQIVVPRLATWCAVHLLDERGAPVLEQVWHEDEDQVAPLRDALGVVDDDDAVAEDALTGESITRIDLIARGRRIGFLTLGRPKGDPLRSEVYLVAESIARRAALAIDNARAHGDLRAVGQSLQQSLLPPSMPTPPGLDVGVVYEAAGEGTAAGGDFYDLFPLSDGSWCFVVGDVCGTGAEAAGVTGLARHTIRALAGAGFPVAAVLERLNGAILDEGTRTRFMTLVCGTLRITGRRVQVSLVNAGHPPPFVVHDDGVVRRIGNPQSLLGVVDNVAFVAEDHVVEGGETLVIVTDGVLERREGDRMLDDEGVTADLEHAAGLPAQGVAERLRRLVVEFTDGPQTDDMAILVIRPEAGASR